MKVLVSACAIGCNCKYNGKNNRNESVIEYLISLVDTTGFDTTSNIGGNYDLSGL